MDVDVLSTGKNLRLAIRINSMKRLVRLLLWIISKAFESAEVNSVCIILILINSIGISMSVLVLHQVIKNIFNS